MICFCSLFLYFLWLRVFSIVGWCFAFSCSLCCFCILRANFGEHQFCFLYFGDRSCCSIPFWIAFCMFSSCSVTVVVVVVGMVVVGGEVEVMVVVFVVGGGSIFVISVLIVLSISCWCLL